MSSKPLCTKENTELCFGRCGVNKQHCSILREMTVGAICPFFKTTKQFEEDLKKYPYNYSKCDRG